MNSAIDQSQVRTEEIRFAFGTFSLGTALVAVSGRGVAAILLGDDRPALRHELASAFSRARLSEDEAGLAEQVRAVVAFLEAPREGLEAALDMRGSALQLAVWNALREVPAGRTTTYGQVAKGLPLTATAQEVGAACAANVLAVAVPCHRVIKADGSFAGYRWGVQRKRQLIERELAR